MQFEQDGSADTWHICHCWIINSYHLTTSSSHEGRMPHASAATSPFDLIGHPIMLMSLNDNILDCWTEQCS